MTFLLGVSRSIDSVSERIGRLTAWLVLVTVLVSAGNAVSRKWFNMSSNGLLELQWYLFGVVFMLGAAWTMRTNEHVRVDVVSSRLRRSTRNWIELFGLLVFFFPFVLLHVYYSWPFFMISWQTQEWSTNPGGLIIWPAKLMVLLGFVLLTAQGVSEFIKRVAIVRGIIPDPAAEAEQPQH
jgi:TRAP-type mannitol/chloroaromatic compound transport system permease small subunit